MSDSPIQSEEKLALHILTECNGYLDHEMHFTHTRIKPQSMCSPCPPSIPRLAANCGHTTS